MSDIRFRWLLADANILIDLAHTGRLTVLKTLREALGAELCIADCVLREIAPENIAGELESMQVTVVRTDTDWDLPLLAESIRTDCRRLSEPDAIQLVLAEKRGWTLWTNDRPLQKAAQSRGVPVCRFFEPLLALLCTGHLTQADLLTLADTLSGEPGHPRNYRDLLLRRLCGTPTDES